MWVQESLIFVGLLLLQAPLTFGQTRSDEAVKKELMQITRDAITATLRNDMAVWESYLADDYMETDENGVVKTKRQVINDFRPVPVLADPKIDIENVDIRVYGDAAVMYFRGNLRLSIPGQKLIEPLQITDFYTRRGGRWLLTAEHQSRIPLPVKGVSVDEKALRSYVGSYRIAPFVIVNFTVEHGKLIRQMLGDKNKDELVPENQTTFFLKGQMRQIIFELDPKGKVVSSLYRLPDGQTIRAQKIDQTNR